MARGEEIEKERKIGNESTNGSLVLPTLVPERGKKRNRGFHSKL